MDADERIIVEFNKLIGINEDQLYLCSFAKQFVFCIVVARCEIDQGGVSVVFEQGLNESQMHTLISGLRIVGETELAALFEQGFAALKAEGFYVHRNWSLISQKTKGVVEKLEGMFGQRLWELDEKLVGLLDMR